MSAQTQARPRDEIRRRLQAVENCEIQAAGGLMVPADLDLDSMIRDLVWLSEGEAVAYVGGERPLFLSWREFRNLTTSQLTPVTGGKPVPTAILWQRDPRRRTAWTRTFKAGADGICSNPDGHEAVNTWRPLLRYPPEIVTPHLFLEHVDYLFADKPEREAFLDWLAHLEQKPGELPHYGWLHVAEHTGCGRNWLASVFARVWRGYTAPNVDLLALLEGNFNGALAGRILAVVDEVQTEAETAYRHANRLKSLINPEFREINPKFGRQYREHNACRWLVFSNHANALPLNDTDRRWRVSIHSGEPRAPEIYQQLYAALNDPAFISSVATYLSLRDISRFNPGERPPMNIAKLAVVDASKSLVQQRAEELLANWPGDLITNTDAADILSEGALAHITPAMRRALDEVGCQPLGRQIRLKGAGERGWALRNAEHWRHASIDAVRAGIYAARTRPGAVNPSNEPANAVLAEACEARQRRGTG